MTEYTPNGQWRHAEGSDSRNALAMEIFISGERSKQRSSCVGSPVDPPEAVLAGRYHRLTKLRYSQPYSYSSPLGLICLMRKRDVMPVFVVINKLGQDRHS